MNFGSALALLYPNRNEIVPEMLPAISSFAQKMFRANCNSDGLVQSDTLPKITQAWASAAIVNMPIFTVIKLGLNIAFHAAIHMGALATCAVWD